MEIPLLSTPQTATWSRPSIASDFRQRVGVSPVELIFLHLYVDYHGPEGGPRAQQRVGSHMGFLKYWRLALVLSLPVTAFLLPGTASACDDYDRCDGVEVHLDEGVVVDGVVVDGPSLPSAIETRIP